MDWLTSLLTDATFWTAVGALATIAATTAIALTARQLRFDAWLKAQEIWVEREFTAARTRVFQQLADTPPSWGADDEEAARLICRRVDEFARLIPYFALRRSTGQKLVLETWADPLAKAWVLLEPLVQTERRTTCWDTKWSEFLALGEAAFAKLPSARQQQLRVVATRLEPALKSSAKQAAPPLGAI